MAQKAYIFDHIYTFYTYKFTPVIFKKNIYLI